jgi:uncharacterized membrane-anchored protein YitT (DUF2179 family)
MEATMKIPAGQRHIFGNLKSFGINMGLILSGSFLFVVGMNSILIPAELLSGGVAGIAVLLHYLTPQTDVGLIYLLLNIPLAAVGWFHVSRRFIYYTMVGIVAFSAMASAVHVPAPKITDPILAALFAGVVCGAGAGIILRSVGSAGGLDILAVVLNKKYGLRPGSVISLVNILIISVGAFFHNFELSLYSIIYVYTSGASVDAVLTGFNRRKSMMIVSDKSEDIAFEILTRVNRGVTYLKGKGAYSGKDKQIIFTIISMAELAKMKEIVFAIDPNAFIVVNDTLEVLGKRHGKMRVF